MHKSIKIKATTLERLKECDGSYDCAVNKGLTALENGLDEATVKQLEKAFGVEIPNVEAFVKSYLINKHDERIKALTGGAANLYSEFGNLENAEMLQTLHKASEKSPTDAIKMISTLLMRKITKDLTNA